MQPVCVCNGIVRFKSNAIVRHILEYCLHDLNDIAGLDFTQDDREQFAQLIGYSVSGYHELNYVSDESAKAASIEARKVARFTAE